MAFGLKCLISLKSDDDFDAEFDLNEIAKTIENDNSFCKIKSQNISFFEMYTFGLIP